MTMATEHDSTSPAGDALSSERMTVRWFQGVLKRSGLILTGAVAIGVLGAISFMALPRDLFPNLALPTLQLLIQSPGRAAAELELAVAQPTELAVIGIPGVRRIASTTQTGLVQVVIAFESQVDPWRARQLVAEKLQQVVGQYPEGTGAPLMTSAAGRLQEIQELVLDGPGVDPMKLRDHAVRSLVPRLQAVPGIARIEVLGGEGRQIQVSVSPERMRTIGASLEQVIEALESSAFDSSAGVLEVRDKQWNVTVALRSRTAPELSRLPVHSAHGVVALGDIAEVREGPEFRMGLSRFEGFEAVSLRVVKQPDAETLATSRRVRALLPELQRAVPDGMSLRLFYDQGELVAHALGGVGIALTCGAIFVGAVLILLLGQLRAALIVIAVLPLAVLGAALPLRWLGHGLNAMTLGGLAIAVGLLVDAGVILVENLAHRLHESGAGSSRALVIARAAAEVAQPIATAVLVILAVFIPLLAIGDVAGALYSPLAVAVAAAMGLSLIFSLTLLPVLVERLLGANTKLAEPRLVGWIKHRYRPWLERALKHRWAVAGIAGALMLGAATLGLRLNSDFLPALDEGAMMVLTSLPSDTSLAAIDAANQRFERELEEIPGVSATYRRTGRGEVTEDPMPTYLSDIMVLLDDGADGDAVKAALEELADHAPFAAEVTTPMNMRISEGIGGTPSDIQVEVYADDLKLVIEAQPRIQALLGTIEGVESVAIDVGAPLASWRIVPDEVALRRLDVARDALQLTAMAALQGVPLSPTYDGVQKIERVVRFPADGRVSIEKLKRLPLIVEEGRIVELGQVATIVEQTVPAMIRRKNGQRRVGFNLRTSGDLNRTAARVEDALREFSLPAGVSIGIAGKVEQARETQRRLLWASVASLLIVIALLYASLSRWREVLVVVGTLPVALAGGVVAMWLAGESWNASSIVGIIGLFGVAVQNSLVLITQVKQLLAQGLEPAHALIEAAVGRVRPKLMTAGAAILGLLPMLFGIGGSELERPLAVVMVGGLVTSTLFTLLVLPTLYAPMVMRGEQTRA
jgi:cobalt-zinc-cadmium resistance protein CzcA